MPPIDVKIAKGLAATVVIVALCVLASCESETTQHQRKVRSEARAGLLRLAMEQERFYIKHQTYSNDMTELGFASDPLVTKSGYYSIDIEPGADANDFVGVATSRLDEAATGNCSTLRIDGRGNRTSAPNASCWTD